ncbi:MAG: hypothetical protein K9W44_16250 [Candidatus Lokiarchaeota archaeon]|nr:hypothetical protein [Candidatus Harpocratesius repetitus]
MTDTNDEETEEKLPNSSILELIQKQSKTISSPLYKSVSTLQDTFKNIQETIKPVFLDLNKSINNVFTSKTIPLSDLSKMCSLIKPIFESSKIIALYSSNLSFLSPNPILNVNYEYHDVSVDVYEKVLTTLSEFIPHLERIEVSLEMEDYSNAQIEDEIHELKAIVKNTLNNSEIIKKNINKLNENLNILKWMQLLVGKKDNIKDIDLIQNFKITLEDSDLPRKTKEQELSSLMIALNYISLYKEVYKESESKKLLQSLKELGSSIKDELLVKGLEYAIQLLLSL